MDSLRGLGDTNLDFLHPACEEGEGIVEYMSKKVFPRVTLISGAWQDKDDWHLGVRLIDLDGGVLNEWQIDPRDIWEKSPHYDSYVGSYNDKRKPMFMGYYCCLVEI